jgi:hypothetical protein
MVVPIFAITLIPDHSRPLPTLLGWLAMVLALAAFPYSLVKYMDTSTLAGTLGGEVATGTRILVFGTFVVIAGLAIGLARSLFRLPAGGTYPARSDGGTRRPGRSQRMAARSARPRRPAVPRVPPKSAAAPDPARAAARPAAGPAGGAAGPEPAAPSDTGD